MRILRFFFKIFVFIIVLSVGTYFVGGKVWLLLAGYSFSKDARSLVSLATDVGDYTTACQNAPASSTSSRPLSFQLRFLDSHTYQIEVVCSLIEDAPVMIKAGRLWPFVYKVPGSSGLQYSLSEGVTSSVTLEVLQDKQTYTLALDKLTQQFGVSAPEQTAIIQNSCSGFGYMCCGSDSQKGVGETRSSGITDCPTICYAKCQAVPYFSAFVSDPFPATERIIDMTTDTLLVTFSYTLDLVGSTVKNVEIDYGDGTTDSATQAVGVFTHTYTCTGPCRYTVAITGTDSDGMSSVATENTRYTVQRK